MNTTEETIVKVHLAPDGRVWYANGLETPVVAPCSRADFVDKLAATDSIHVRVIGTVANAPLIVDLYQKCCSPQGSGKLEVASPTVCAAESERRDPVITLYRMRQCLLSPSLGGWHQVTDLDYPAYALAAQFATGAGFTENVKSVLQTHPVYHDLTFIPTVNLAAVAELLGGIIDPRWFVDTRNPYRLSRLKMYLGLTPGYMTSVVAGNITGERFSRCALTLAAWGGDQPQPSAADCERPGNFLWRRWLAAGGGVKGNLRATQSFVTYLTRTWQQQLSNRSAQNLEMFIPGEMLRGCEVAAYKNHTKNR